MKIQRAITGSLLTTAVMCLVSVLLVSGQTDGKATKSQLISRLNELMEKEGKTGGYYVFREDEIGGVTWKGEYYKLIAYSDIKSIVVQASGGGTDFYLDDRGNRGKYFSVRLMPSGDRRDLAATLESLVKLVKSPARGSELDQNGSVGQETVKKSVAGGLASPAPTSGDNGAIIVSDEASKKAEAVRKEQAAASAKQRAVDVANATRARALAKTPAARAEADRRWKAALIACFGSANAAARAKSTKATVTCQ